MILNKAEFLAMNNPLRAMVQEKYEFPILLKMSTNRSYSSGLEIGCGNGHGTRLIRKYYQLEKLAAVDLDERMIELARKHNKDRSIDFMVMDACNLEFPNASFDVVFDFTVIHHIPNWHDCIHELRRVLKDDGELILEDLSIESFSGFPGIMWKRVSDHPYKGMFTFIEFTEYLEENGFTIVSKRIANPMRLVKHVSLIAKINNAKDA